MAAPCSLPPDQAAGGAHQPCRGYRRDADNNVGVLQADGYSLTVCPAGALCSVETDLIFAVPASTSASTLAGAFYNTTSTAQFQASLTRALTCWIERAQQQSCAHSAVIRHGRQ